MQRLTDRPVIPGHPLWDAFVTRLEGPEGCAFRSEGWTCPGDHRLSMMILGRMGLGDAGVLASIAYFRSHGGCCDCEVVLNLENHG